MKKCIDKAAIENILHKLWKKDTGFENIDIAIIAYNRALQDVHKAIDTKQEEPVSEDKMTISKEWFEHCKKSWYNEGYIDGEYNRDRQLEEPISDDLGEFINELSKQFPEVSFAKVCKIATRTAKWKEQQMMKDAVDACVTGIRTYKEENEADFTVMYEKGIIPYEIEQEVKLIIIKED